MTFRSVPWSKCSATGTGLFSAAIRAICTMFLMPNRLTVADDVCRITGDRSASAAWTIASVVR